MKLIIFMALFLICKNETLKGQREKDVITKRDTFYRATKELTYILYTYWEKHPEFAPTSPKIDTLRIISFLDSFLYSVSEREIPSVTEKIRIRVSINTIRFPGDLNLFYGIDILVNGKDKTAAEDFWLFRSYSKDVKWNKIYNEVWFSNDYLNIWLTKWYTALKKKLKRKKLFSG